jgi:hypothetical protein
MMKKLTFKDAKSGETLFHVSAQFDENECFWFVVDTSSPVYLTYEFMIECAIYGINEGQTDFGTYDDDNLKPLAFWALTDRAI